MRNCRVGASVLLAGILLQNQAGAAVKFQMIQGRPIVDRVYLNGMGPYRFLIDTGTKLNHFDPDLAQSNGLNATFRGQLVSSTGSLPTHGADGIEVTLDNLRVDGQRFLFAGIGALHKRYPDVQGILGEEFLSRFDYLLDLRGKRLEFGKPEPGSAKTRAMFRIVDGRPIVSTSLGSLVLDSGANQIVLFNVEADSMTHELFTMTGSARVGMVSRKLVIGGRTVWQGNAVAMPHSIEKSAAGLLPTNLFKTVYVCNSAGYMVFTERHDQLISTAGTRLDRHGLTLILPEEKTVASSHVPRREPHIDAEVTEKGGAIELCRVQPAAAPQKVTTVSELPRSFVLERRTEMTILVEKGTEYFGASAGAAMARDPEYRPERVIVRDVVCPEGKHFMSQQWTVEELRELLDIRAPVFHCDTHAYKWNPGDRELQELRGLCNAIDGRY